jgi:O-antigen/teichoic acid export membrane protein
MSVSKLINSSLLLFVDQLVVGAGGWVYWLIISKLASTSEIGLATTVYNLVILIATVVELGLDYPLLKRSSIDRSRLLGTALFLELLITLAAIPVLIYILDSVYAESLQSFSWIAALMLILISLGFVSRFALLGISNVRTVLIVDTLSTGAKFITGFALVAFGFGVFGMLLSFLLQTIIIAGVILWIASKRLGIQLGDVKYAIELLRDGLINMPSKLSKTLIFSLSVVLLAYAGIASSDVGIFYIALMISMYGGSLISSMAYMVVPASTMSKTDLSFGSSRIALSLTAPLVAGLIAAPQLVLSVIGAEYTAGESLLVVLAIAILPFSVVTNAISKFNYLCHARKLLAIGSIQVSVFLIAFFALVPYYQTLGASISILLAYSVASIPAIFWTERALTRYIANSGLAIMIGGISGFGLSLLGTSLVVQFVSLVVSIAITLVLIIALKNTSINEIRELIRSSVKNTVQSKALD